MKASEIKEAIKNESLEYDLGDNGSLMIFVSDLIGNEHRDIQGSLRGQYGGLCSSLFQCMTENDDLAELILSVSTHYSLWLKQNSDKDTDASAEG